jgi:hypothetical protein
MNIKTIVGSALALVLVALAGWVSPVDAGGGGEGISLGSLFAFNCYLINGVNPPHELALDDQFFAGDGAENPRRSPVALGKAKLLCTQPFAVGLTNDPLPNPAFNPRFTGTNPEATDHLVCYETSSSTPKTSQPVAVKTTEDPFVTQTVQIGAPAFTCVGALKCDAGSTSCPPLPQ